MLPWADDAAMRLAASTSARNGRAKCLPVRAFWPLCPRPAVFPLLEPIPRPSRRACSATRRHLSVDTVHHSL